MKQKLKLTIFAIAVTAALAAADPSETETHRLLHPSFEELQAEFVWQRISTYHCVPDALIEHALDKHFERIEFFAFDCDEGDAQ